MPPSPPRSVSSALKQSCRLSGCWLVHSALCWCHMIVGAMQVYKLHTLSGGGARWAVLLARCHPLPPLEVSSQVEEKKTVIFLSPFGL